MIVYVVAKANTCDDYDVDILGVFKNERDAEKCFADYILERYDDEDMTIDDLDDEEKEGIKDWDYWDGIIRLTIFKKDIK